MTVHPLGVEVSCDGPDPQSDCPDSAAIPIRFGSMTAREDGWTRQRRAGRLVDLCPSCAARPAAG